MGTLTCVDCNNVFSERLRACPQCSGPVVRVDGDGHVSDRYAPRPASYAHGSLRPVVVESPYSRPGISTERRTSRAREWPTFWATFVASVALSLGLVGALHGLGDAYNVGQVIGGVLTTMFAPFIAVACRARKGWIWGWFLAIFALMAIGMATSKRDMAMSEEARALSSMASEALNKPDEDVPLASLPPLTGAEASSLDGLRDPQSEPEMMRYVRLTYQQVVGDAAREVKALETQLATLPIEQVLEPQNLVTHERIAWGRSQMDQAYALISRRNAVTVAANRTLDERMARIPRTSAFGRGFWKAYENSRTRRDGLSGRIVGNQAALKGQFDGLLDLMDDLVGQTQVQDDQLVFQDQDTLDQYSAFIARIDVLAKEEATLQGEALQMSRNALNKMASGPAPDFR